MVLRSGWVALGPCLLLLLPSLALAASSTDDTSLNGHPLRPADTTSPRATLRSFQETVREVVRRHRARLPPADVDRAIAKVLDTLDLSGLPPAERVDQGVERATLLLDILDRIALPPLAQIPDAAAVEASGLKRWTIPNTEITIARTEEGRDAGRFQFTWPTVQQLPAFYELVKHVPPKPGSLAGVYEEWSYAPGPWVPSGWTTKLPAFAYIVVWHQRVWQWVAACATVGLTFVVILLAYRLARRIDRIGSMGRDQGNIARLAATIAAIALLLFATRVLDDAVNLTGRRLFLVNGVLDVALYSAVGWTIILGLETLGTAVIRLREARPSSIDAALVLGHPMITPEPARVRFVGYGGYSKDVEIFAYLRCQDQDTFLAIKEDILLRVGDIVLEGGSGFAFPSQTTYFSRDGGLKENRKQTAETQVSLWRARGRLPFPEFEEQERDRLRDVLDYPPKGSPHYEPSRSDVERQQIMASSTFAVEDLVDLPSFVAKLRVGSALAEHFVSQFSAETRTLLSNYEGGADAELTEALVRDLNAVVCGTALYKKKRFEQADLGPETEELLKRAPEGEDRQRLNRLFLQDAYPSELSHRKAMA